MSTISPAGYQHLTVSCIDCCSAFSFLPLSKTPQSHKHLLPSPRVVLPASRLHRAASVLLIHQKAWSTSCPVLSNLNSLLVLYASHCFLSNPSVLFYPLY